MVGEGAISSARSARAYSSQREEFYPHFFLYRWALRCGVVMFEARIGGCRRVEESGSLISAIYQNDSQGVVTRFCVAMNWDCSRTRA
jgi:hypothetical protein